MENIRGNAKRRIISEINITPLTDVALVLLVIFMVTSPLLIQTGFKVKLPEAHAATSQPSTPLIITLTREGKIFLNDQMSVSRQQLGDILKQKLTQNNDQVVLVRADQNARHGDVVELLDIAKAAGAQKLAIAVENKP